MRRAGQFSATAVVLFMALASVIGVNAKGQETLRFSDNFDRFDLSKWKHEMTMGGGGNWEFQLYHNSRQNSYVRDGVLYLKPTLTADLIGEDKVLGGHRMDMWGSQPADLCTGNQWWGCERTSSPSNILNPLASARLRTAETFTFKYGRVEVRAKLPLGEWLWPAIWMLPIHNSYGQWPASGEIDICESRGNDLPGKQFGADTYFSTLHWGPNFDTNGFKATSKTLSLPAGQKFSDQFHTYGLYWDEEQLYTYLDDPKNVVFSIKFKGTSFWERGKSLVSTWANAKNLFNPWTASDSDAAPFDQEFFLIMNCAVGGTMNYFPDGTPGKPWTDKSPTAVRDFYNAKSQWYPTWKGEDAALQIDSVNIWTFPNSVFHYPRGNLTFASEAIRNPNTSPLRAEAKVDANDEAASGAAPGTSKSSVAHAVQQSVRLEADPASPIEVETAPPTVRARAEPLPQLDLQRFSNQNNETLAFMVMSIVALVVAIGALVGAGLVLYWTKKNVTDLEARLLQSTATPPVPHARGTESPLSHEPISIEQSKHFAADDTPHPLSPTRVDTA